MTSVLIDTQTLFALGVLCYDLKNLTLQEFLTFTSRMQNCSLKQYIIQNSRTGESPYSIKLQVYCGKVETEREV
jgi:hypothetical protein